MGRRAKFIVGDQVLPGACTQDLVRLRLIFGEKLNEPQPIEHITRVRNRPRYHIEGGGMLFSFRSFELRKASGV